MRKANFFFCLFLFLFLTACEKSTKREEVVLPKSTGQINSVSVIIDDALWNGEIGDELRKKLAAPVDGLQEEEPLFTLNQYSPKIFSGNVRLGRNIVIITKGPEPEFKHVLDKYSVPQNIFYISGHNLNEIVQTIELHAQALTSSVSYSEIIENQKATAKDLFNDKKIRQKFNLTLQIPNSFSYALLKNKFVWLKKDIPAGNSSLLIYEVPFSALRKGREVHSTIRLRDSIGKKYIHGLMDKSSMQTEESYYPYVSKTIIDDRPASEMRGTWELQNNIMNGPFLNYVIKDAKNHRYIIAEGFVYNPSGAKRDQIFELESIIKSMQFLNLKRK